MEKKEYVRFNIKCLKSLALTICLIFSVYLFFFLNQSIYFFGWNLKVLTISKILTHKPHNSKPLKWAPAGISEEKGECDRYSAAEFNPVPLPGGFSPDFRVQCFLPIMSIPLVSFTEGREYRKPAGLGLSHGGFWPGKAPQIVSLGVFSGACLEWPQGSHIRWES